LYQRKYQIKQESRLHTSKALNKTVISKHGVECMQIPRFTSLLLSGRQPTDTDEVTKLTMKSLCKHVLQPLTWISSKPIPRPTHLMPFPIWLTLSNIPRAARQHALFPLSHLPHAHHSRIISAGEFPLASPSTDPTQSFTPPSSAPSASIAERRPRCVCVCEEKCEAQKKRRKRGKGMMER